MAVYSFNAAATRVAEHVLRELRVSSGRYCGQKIGILWRQALRGLEDQRVLSLGRVGYGQRLRQGISKSKPSSGNLVRPSSNLKRKKKISKQLGGCLLISRFYTQQCPKSSVLVFFGGGGGGGAVLRIEPRACIVIHISSLFLLS